MFEFIIVGLIIVMALFMVLIFKKIDAPKKQDDELYALNLERERKKDLSDLNGLVQTMDKSEIKLLCDERPELIADYILAVYSGYDLTDEKDCELNFDGTKQQNIFDDTKPYGKKEVNNAK